MSDATVFEEYFASVFTPNYLQLGDGVMSEIDEGIQPEVFCAFSDSEEDKGIDADINEERRTK